MSCWFRRESSKKIIGNSVSRSVKTSLKEGEKRKRRKRERRKRRRGKGKWGRTGAIIREEEKERGSEGEIAIMAVAFHVPKMYSLLHLLIWEN